MGWLILSFLMIVFVFGTAYTLLTPCGHGIGQDSQPLAKVTLGTGIYFSIVTYSSLGYGDMHPMGLSRVLACLEVLLGLASIGILIARVTSRRLSHHVSRLFSTDAQERLEAIATELETSSDELRQLMPQLQRAYQSDPGPGTSPSLETRALLTKVGQFALDLRSRCVHLHDYWATEMAQGSYFQIAPVTGIERVGEALDDVFFRLSQLVIALSPQARADILDRRTRQRISEAIDRQMQLCQLAEQHPDQDIRLSFQGIGDTCNRLQENYFAVPDLEESQPDQVLQDSDLPQEIPGEPQ